MTPNRLLALAPSYNAYRERIDALERALVVFTSNPDIFDPQLVQMYELPLFYENDKEIRRGVGVESIDPSFILYNCGERKITVMRGVSCIPALINLIHSHVPLRVRRSPRLLDPVSCTQKKIVLSENKCCEHACS